jgi:hypothetical protein
MASARRHSAQAVVLEEAELVTAKWTRVGRACDAELQ